MQFEHVNRQGPVAWMVLNSKVVNLLMLVLIAGGIYVTQTIKKEVFPEFDVDAIQVSVAVNGASPEEIEQSVVLAIEEALGDVEGLDEVESTATENSAVIEAELLAETNRTQVFQDVSQAISGISTLPDEAETPVISMSARKRQVLALTIHGDILEWQLREYAEAARDQLLTSSQVTQAAVRGGRDYEVQALVDQLTMERLGLSLADVASAIATASVERAGGSIYSTGGEILLKVSSRAQWAEEYAQLPILEQTNGSTLLLGDIATVVDKFNDEISSHRFDGETALSIDIYRVGDQTPTGVSDAVHQILPEIQQTLPNDVRITLLQDSSEVYRSRLHLLLKNASLGLILVMLLLTLFLDVRLAFWVTLGIPTAFLGGMLFLPGLGVSINMISMFAFILALGIVVDDAIIAGENIYEYQQRGYNNIDAAIMGIRTVLTPLTFSILSNIVAFIPLMFLPGRLGMLFFTIPLVVVSVFIISWVEAVLIMPAHLAHTKSSNKDSSVFAVFSIIQQRFSRALDCFVRAIYQPLLLLCLRYRYITFVSAISLFVIVGSYVLSGRIGFSLMPRVESDRAGVTLTLPVGSPMLQMQSVEALVLDSVNTLRETSEQDDNILGVESSISENVISVVVHLSDENTRTVSASGLISLWRQEMGQIAGVETLQFESDIGGPGRGKALTVELSHRDVDTLELAGTELTNVLNEFSNLSDISDGFTEGKQQLDFILMPKGENLGLTVNEISNQVRAAFYGIEAEKQQRGRHEVTTLVRLLQDQRDSEYDLNQLKIVTPGGDFVPLVEVARIERGHAVTNINHRQGKRVIQVDANISPIDETSIVIAELNDGILRQLESDYPGLSTRFIGKEADVQDSSASLKFSVTLASFILYVLLVIPFNSYIQPLLVLIAIPFGIIGAIVGHMVMGYALSMISVLGIVALSGVVINDSLVMIDYANKQRRHSTDAQAAILAASIRRFRPIILTTITTFCGLAPMIFETSRQARFLIPMAISLGYGILFSTVICLLLVPAMYLMLDDLQGCFLPRQKASAVPVS